MANSDPYEWRLVGTSLTAAATDPILPVKSSHFYFVLNEVGTGEITIPLNSASAALVSNGKLAVLYYRGAIRGSFFVENIRKREADASEAAGQYLSISGRGGMSLLERAIIWSDGTTSKTRTFTGVTKGSILKTLIDEAVARSGLTGLTYDFDATNDSDSVAWTDTETYTLNVGMKLLALLRQFAETGINFEVNYSGTGFVLSAYKNGIGTDKSSSVYFRTGKNCQEIDIDQRGNDIRNALLVAYRDGDIVVTDSASITANGRREDLLDARLAQTSASATTYGSAVLETKKDPLIGRVIKVYDGISPYVFVNYILGDTITLDITGTETNDRILGIQCDFDGYEYSNVVIELNSLILEKNIKLAQDVDWLLNQWNTAHDANLLEVSYWAAIGDPEITFTVSDIHLVGTKLFVLSSTYSYYYEITTGVWTTLPAMNTPNCAVSIGTDLYIGSFHSVYKFDTTNDTLIQIAVVSNSGEPAQERVWRMAVIGTTLYVVGVFDSIDGVVAGSMAQYDTLTDTWTAWAGGLVGTIQCLLASGSNIVIGGTFTEIDGVLVTNVALWNGSAITAMSTGLDGSVLTLAVYGANILAGGSFTGSISEWGGAAWTTFGGGITGGVSGIAVYLTDVYVVGDFTDKGNYIAKYSGGAWWELGTGLNASVTDIILYEQDIYVAGDFTTAGDKSALKLAAYFNNFEALADYLENSSTFNMGAAIHNATAAALTDASEHPFWDAVTNKLRKITWANIKATLLGNTADTQVLYNNAGVLDGSEEFIYDDTGQIISLGKTGGNEASHIISWAAGGVSFHNLLSWGTGIYSSIRGIAARGTKAAPTALLEDDVAMRYRFSAYDGVGLVANSVTGAEIKGVANEDQSATHHGMRMEFWITPNGTTIEERLAKIDEYGIPLIMRVVNKTGVQLNAGQAVYVNGAQGNRPTAALAKADAESTSHGLLGFIVDNIANNAEGYMQTFGVMPYNTSGFTAGNDLYLSATTSGELTNVKPVAPNHPTFMAVALNSTVNGKIFIRPQSGFEIDELHDVLFTGLANDDILQRKSGLWGNRTMTQLATDLTPSLNAVYESINGWNPTSWAGLTRVSATVFTTTTDISGIIQKGYKLKLTDTTTKYFTVISAPFAAGVTTITTIASSDFALVGNPSNVYWSNIDLPFGFPALFNYTPTVSAQTGTPTTVTINSATYNAKNGTMVIGVKFTIANKGTASNGFYFTAPCDAIGVAVGVGRENAVVGCELQGVIDGTGANPNRVNILRYDNVTIWVDTYVVYLTLVMGW